MLTTLLVLSLGATPLSLELDLSQPTVARVGMRVELALTQRLEEEGFSLVRGAPLRVRVEELHGKFKLSARRGAVTLEREYAPVGDAWREELLLELCQRVALLAHEGAASPSATVTGAEVAPEPVAAEPEREAPAERETPRVESNGDGFPRMTAGLRAGVAMRFPSYDFTGGIHGALAFSWQPTLFVGVTFAPTTRLSVVELPLLAGIRRPIAVASWLELIPELLVGPRVHLAWEPGGTAEVLVDALGTLGATFAVRAGRLLLGLRLGAEVSVPREHVLGTEVVWSRPPFALTLQLTLDRWSPPHASRAEPVEAPVPDGLPD